MNKKALMLSAAILAVITLFGLRYLMDHGRLTTEAEYEGLARSVTGNDLVSDHDPAVVLRFDPSLRYLGGQKFVLYGVADTEQHFFVETTPDDRLRSVYWIQFEGYLPEVQSRYDYDDSPLRLQLGDYEFYTDTAAVHPDPRNRRSGSDGARAREFLTRAGYSYPEDFAYARLVYLTDASQRKELMIIVIDDLARYGYTAAELAVDGAAHDRWPEVEAAHLDRIRQSLTLIPGPGR